MRRAAACGGRGFLPAVCETAGLKMAPIQEVTDWEEVGAIHQAPFKPWGGTRAQDFFA